jgi:hypothetical protein
VSVAKSSVVILLLGERERERELNRGEVKELKEK